MAFTFSTAMPVSAQEDGDITFDMPVDENGVQPLYLTEGIAVTNADLLDDVSAEDENGGGINRQYPTKLVFTANNPLASCGAYYLRHTIQ